jgi:CRISPR type I-D-associated protein Csc2
MASLLNDLRVLSRGTYLQYVTSIKLLDDAIIRSNEPEEVLTYTYKKKGLGNRFIIPWRKVKGKVRRATMEKMRGLGIAPDCHLKDGLCMKCPCCVLFGGTGDVSDAKVGYNLLSRVLGDTFISTSPVDTINSSTANAVDEKSLTTGQALMTLVRVPAETEFVGVITLRDPTKDAAAIVLDALQRLTRIGASTREWGRCLTTVEGYYLSDREQTSSFELAGEALPTFEPVTALDLPAADQGFKEFAEQCDTMLRGMADTKKTSVKKGAKVPAKKAAKGPDESPSGEGG